jgi:hypothetical protein
MRISIRSNIPEVSARLDDLVKRQAPFALSLALNKTITTTRNVDLMREYSRFFEMRNKKFFQQVHQIRPSVATYTRKTGMAIAAIQRSELPSVSGTTKQGKARTAQTSFMERHTRGGTKTPRTRRNIAVPIAKNVTRKRAGAKAGAVNRSFEPKTVMQSDRGFIFQKGSRKFIAQRTGKSKIKVLYTLTKSAQIKGGYNPEAAVKRGMGKYFKIQYKQAWIQALRTARLRA